MSTAGWKTNLEKNLLFLLETEKKTYDTDFKNMIKTFQTEESRGKKIEKNFEKIRKNNDNWRKKVESIRDSKESVFSSDRIDKLRKIEEKEKLNERIIKENLEKKLEIMKNLKKHSRSVFQKIRNRVKTSLEIEEKERLNLENEIEEKIFKYIKKNREIKDSKKTEFDKKLCQSLMNFNKNHTSVEKQHLDILMEKNQKPLKRYENWYINHFLNEKKEKEAKNQVLSQKEIVTQQNLERILEDRLKTEEVIFQKLKDSEIKRNILKDERSEKFQSQTMRMKEKFLKSKEKINLTNRMRFDHNNEIIRRQCETILKARNIEDTFGETKSTFFEKTILAQIDSEKKVQFYLKMIEQEKNKSLMKKGIKQKKWIYIDLKKKKAEEEKMRKEEEEKKKNRSE